MGQENSRAGMRSHAPALVPLLVTHSLKRERLIWLRAPSSWKWVVQGQAGEGCTHSGTQEVEREGGSPGRRPSFLPGHPRWPPLPTRPHHLTSTALCLSPREHSTSYLVIYPPPNRGGWGEHSRSKPQDSPSLTREEPHQMQEWNQLWAKHRRTGCKLDADFLTEQEVRGQAAPGGEVHRRV